MDLSVGGGDEEHVYIEDAEIPDILTEEQSSTAFDRSTDRRMSNASSTTGGMGQDYRAQVNAQRNKYLSKLAYSGAWQSQGPTPGTTKLQNLTIFDWDDTLFPTSAFTPRTEEEMMRIAANNKLLFSQLDLIVSGLLKRACQNQAKVLIVTNAHKSWVDYSSQTLLPLTAELLRAQV